jgi:hypothetical protein
MTTPRSWCASRCSSSTSRGSCATAAATPRAVRPRRARRGGRGADGIKRLRGAHEEAAGPFHRVDPWVVDVSAGDVLVARVRGQLKRALKLRGALEEHGEEVHDVGVAVVEDLVRRRPLGVKHRGGPGERLDVHAMRRKQAGDERRQPTLRAVVRNGALTPPSPPPSAVAPAAAGPPASPRGPQPCPGRRARAPSGCRAA